MLDRPQRAVETVLRREFSVRAALDHAAAVDHEDEVRVHHRAQAVRDDDLGLRRAACAQRAEDRGLGVRVDRRKRIVEHEQPRLLRERARDRHALALSAGKRHALLAHDGLVALGEREDRVVHARDLRGGVRRFITDRAVARACDDVLAQLLRVEKRLLHHGADRAADRRARHTREREAIDRNRAARRLVEPQQKLDDRRLARARRPDEAERLPRLELEAHAVEHLWSAAMRKAHVVKAHGEASA